MTQRKQAPVETIVPLEPLAEAACPWCPWHIHDEQSVVMDALAEHEELHARLARRRDRCSRCGCPVDVLTVGCDTCKQRFRSRARKAAA